MFDRVFAKLNQSSFDGLLIQNRDNINWICHRNNYEIPGMVLVIHEDAYIITKSRNIEAIQELYKEFHVIYGDLEKVQTICNSKKISRLGYEENKTTVTNFKVMNEVLKRIELVNASDFIEDLRMIKTDREIKLLEEAARLSDASYVEFLNHIRPGMTEIQLKNVLRSIFFRNGAHDLSFDILISSGKNAFMPHSTSTQKPIEDGDLVLMDFGIVLNGYCTDTTRTIVMGEATDIQKERYDIVLKAQKKALESIKAGHTMREADAYARKYIESAIQGGCYDHGLGHGIGRTVHEKPRLHPAESAVLMENTVVTVEPGIYIKDWGGIRIEDMLVVSNGQGLVLTKAPKELITI